MNCEHPEPCKHRQKFFAVLYVVVFFAAMWNCTSWSMDMATLSSIPIIMCAEAIVLGMLYVSIFHGEPGAEMHSTIASSATKMQHTREAELAHSGK